MGMLAWFVREVKAGSCAAGHVKNWLCVAILWFPGIGDRGLVNRPASGLT